MTNTELKECPFCGSSCLGVHVDGTCFTTICADCYMDGPLRRTEAEAITAWNTRHPNPSEVRNAALEEAGVDLNKIAREFRKSAATAHEAMQHRVGVSEEASARSFDRAAHRIRALKSTPPEVTDPKGGAE